MKLLVLGNFANAITVILGAVFIVLLASTLGVLTQSKKLFEVLFFMVAYANINGVPFLDYFGGTGHNTNYVLKLVGFIIVLLMATFFKRKMDLERN